MKKEILKDLSNKTDLDNFYFIFMFSNNEFNKLAKKYGKYSSWAIWDREDENNLLVIKKNISDLHSNYVFLGLNVASPLNDGPWKNFHGGKHDRRLKYAMNDTKLRGSYLTDIFKGIPESKSSKFKEKLTDKLIKENVSFFKKEMKDIKITKDTTFVLFGNDVQKYFYKYFNSQFNNKTIDYYHYSYLGSRGESMPDDKWVEGLWGKLGINRDFDLIKQKYQK